MPASISIVVKPCDPDLLVEEIERLLHAADGVRTTSPASMAVEHRHNNG